MKKTSVLNDSDFLKLLDNYHNKVIYAKIISLTVDEFPQEEIVGKVISGSINVDGTSSVRRTCSLSLVAQGINLNSFYWGMQSKFKLFIGIENHIDNSYPDIIWFPQGIYIITNFSSSQTTNSYTISIQGKDKMCLLNGDLGGLLTANSTVFDSNYEELSDKSLIQEKVYIKDIIYKLVHQLGGEKISNIIINNLDDYGLELLEYKGDVPLYLIFDDNEELIQTFIDGNVKIWIEGKSTSTLLKNLREDTFIFKTLNPPIANGIGNSPTKIKMSASGEAIYTIAKCSRGQTVGYKLTNLTYGGDLVGNVGEALTSVLDKIKQQLGDFEYFYDVEGKFIFQRVQTYLNVSWNPLRNTSIDNPNNLSTPDAYIEASIYASPFSYNFEGNKLISSMNNSPNLLNIKNDYTIWGARKSGDHSVPIHLRYAIDKKPSRYKTYRGAIYSTDTYDWREIIYQMALDWMTYHDKDDFTSTLIQYNPEYFLGKTGYESYYIDMEGFWRQIYDPSQETASLTDISTHWKSEVFTDPSSLNFWIDFLDTEGELGQFSVQSIGRRQKVVKDDNVQSIYFKQTPLAIFYTDNADFGKKSGYSYFKLGQNTEEYFERSAQKKSAQDELNKLLYQHTSAQETISLTTIPIYYLQPNTLIFVKDDCNLDINGKYSVTRYSIPLSHNGMMNITATKIVDQII